MLPGSPPLRGGRGVTLVLNPLPDLTASAAGWLGSWSSCMQWAVQFATSDLLLEIALVFGRNHGRFREEENC